LNVVASSSFIWAISCKAFLIKVSFNGMCCTVKSMSLVMRESTPTIDEIKTPPFKTKLLLNLLTEIRSKNRSMKNRVNKTCGLRLYFFAVLLIRAFNWIDWFKASPPRVCEVLPKRQVALRNRKVLPSFCSTIASNFSKLPLGRICRQGIYR